MDRRSFLAGLIGGAGGLLVPGPLVVPEPRVWALGRWHSPAEARWLEALTEARDEMVRERLEWYATFRTTVTLGVEDGRWRVVAPTMAEDMTRWAASGAEGTIRIPF